MVLKLTRLRRRRRKDCGVFKLCPKNLEFFKGPVDEQLIFNNRSSRLSPVLVLVQSGIWNALRIVKPRVGSPLITLVIPEALPMPNIGSFRRNYAYSG